MGIVVGARVEVTAPLFGSARGNVQAIDTIEPHDVPTTMYLVRFDMPVEPMGPGSVVVREAWFLSEELQEVLA